MSTEKCLILSTDGLRNSEKANTRFKELMGKNCEDSEEKLNHS